MRTTSPPPTPSMRRFWRQRKITTTATAGLTASTNASSSKLHQIPSMTQVWQALPIRMFGLYVYWVWGFENFFSVPLRFSHHVRPTCHPPLFSSVASGMSELRAGCCNQIRIFTMLCIITCLLFTTAILFPVPKKLSQVTLDTKHASAFYLWQLQGD